MEIGAFLQVNRFIMFHKVITNRLRFIYKCWNINRLTGHVKHLLFMLTRKIVITILTTPFNEIFKFSMLAVWGSH